VIQVQKTALSADRAIVPQVDAIMNLVNVLHVPTKQCMATFAKNNAVIIAPTGIVTEMVLVHRDV